MHQELILLQIKTAKMQTLQPGVDHQGEIHPKLNKKERASQYIQKTLFQMKMAEATLAKAQAAQAKAEADNKMADAEKGKTKLQMMDKYMALLYKDTTGYDEVTKVRHEEMLTYLATQLFS